MPPLPPSLLLCWRSQPVLVWIIDTDTKTHTHTHKYTQRACMCAALSRAIYSKSSSLSLSVSLSPFLPLSLYIPYSLLYLICRISYSKHTSWAEVNAICDFASLRCTRCYRGLRVRDTVRHSVHSGPTLRMLSSSGRKVPPAITSSLLVSCGLPAAHSKSVRMQLVHGRFGRLAV